MGNKEYISATNILFHFTFLHGFNPFYINSIIGGEWYIGMLVIVYFISPIIYIRNLKQALLVFTISSFISCWVTNILISLAPNINNDIWVAFIDPFSIIAEFPVIAMGTVLYYVINKSALDVNRKNSNLILVISLIYLYLILLINEPKYISIYSLYSVGFLGLIYSQILYESKLIVNRVFQIIGKYSYGTYLFHLLFINIIPEMKLSNVYISWIINYIIIFISLSASIILSNCLEKPFIRFVKRIQLKA